MGCHVSKASQPSEKGVSALLRNISDIQSNFVLKKSSGNHSMATIEEQGDVETSLVNQRHFLSCSIDSVVSGSSNVHAGNTTPGFHAISLKRRRDDSRVNLVSRMTPIEV